MNWTRITEVLANVPMPDGYRLQQLQRSEIPLLVDPLKAWFPEITVGAASCYLREEFYARQVFFEGESSEPNFIVILAKKDQELVGMYSAEVDRDTLGLFARLAVVAPSTGVHIWAKSLSLSQRRLAGRREWALFTEWRL